MKGERRIGLISDTHGSVPAKIYEVFSGVEMVLHAGDVDSPEVLSDLAVIAPVLAVRGNMDRHFLLSSLPVARVVEWAGRRIAIIHNLVWLSSQLAALDVRLAEINVVVFGHTHKPVCYREAGILYVNPGAARQGERHASAALLRLPEGGELEVIHIPLR